jgi:hypothetical protein
MHAADQPLLHHVDPGEEGAVVEFLKAGGELHARRTDGFVDCFQFCGADANRFLGGDVLAGARGGDDLRRVPIRQRGDADDSAMKRS